MSGVYGYTMFKTAKTLLSIAVLSTVPAQARHRETANVELSKLIGDRVAGKPTDCISLSSITSSQIIEGRAIVYRIGSRLYVNEPRSGASSLGEDDMLVTRTTGSQLCSIDTVSLVDRTSRFPRGLVSLGRFVPYARAVRPD